ncbi:MAG: hypothetical protein IJ776_01030 [Paludibacteraceae bacterium]|nr:hypothetical protein [Paludibacteraceae bacterium]
MKTSTLLVSMSILCILLTVNRYSALAACTGHSNNVDPYYTEHDNAAATELPLGYDWSIRTTVVGVEISVTFQDDFVGLTAPYMFMFDKDGQLIGGDFPMQNWNPNTRTATHTLTGYNEGDSITFLVKMAYALHVLFTKRIYYVVGTTCDEEEIDMVVNSAVENVKTTGSAQKLIENGTMFILNGDRKYTATGMEIK